MSIGDMFLVAVFVGVAVYAGLRLAVYQIEEERKKQNDNNHTQE